MSKNKKASSSAKFALETDKTLEELQRLPKSKQKDFIYILEELVKSGEIKEEFGLEDEEEIQAVVKKYKEMKP